jgi:pimeloyl-ACP methyl ester carboxylesterase
MYYEEYGDKNSPAIIFLHGAMAFRTFARQKELAEKFRLIFYALPGHGEDYDRDFDRNTAISEIVEIIKSLDKKPHLVGFSLGAQLAVSLLDGYGDLIDRAAIVSPLIDSGDAAHKILSLNTRLVGFSTKFKPIAKIVSMFMGIDKEKYPKFVREQKNQKVNKLSYSVLQDMLMSDDLKNIRSIENPVLILAGDLEYRFFKQSAEKLNEMLKNGTLKFYGAAGHNIPFAHYKKFNKDLIDFFGR